MKRVYIGLIVMGSILIILSIIGFVIFYERFNMIFHDCKPHNIVPGTSGNFPKRIHQTWKTHEVPKENRNWVQSVRTIYSDYEYHLWDDAEIDQFARSNFPEFVDVWDKLTPFIKKVDTIRYMWMYKLGGMYFDLDVHINKRMKDQMFEKYPNAAFVPISSYPIRWKYDKDRASPAIIASYPGHPFWLAMLDYIRVNYDRDVLYATGPIAVSNVIRDRNWSNMVFLSEPRLGLTLKVYPKYSYHVNTTTWREKCSPQNV